jgi:glycosyltransferase involved in cell wall biosynthesis
MTQIQSKIRILHVFGRMDRGGAETWIVNVLRTIDRSRYQFDFLVQPGPDGAYDDEIRRLGGRVIKGPSPSNPLSYVIGVVQLLRSQEPYDVIHSHVHHFSGVTLAIGRLMGIPERIAHSHNDLRQVERTSTIGRRFYNWAMERSILQFATTGVAVSEGSAISLFGGNWKDDRRFRILHCGVDLQPFSCHAENLPIRDEMSIPSDAVVIGHVGSFSTQKNHRFVIRVFAELVRMHPEAVLILVGTGPLEAEIRLLVQEMGLLERVRFLGVRSDIPQLMMGAFDWFLLPSLYEGIPLVLMEAQAAGLSILVSENVSEEAIVIPDLFKQLSLATPAVVWARALLRPTVRRKDALSRMEGSTFNIRHSVDDLEELYERVHER